MTLESSITEVSIKGNLEQFLIVLSVSLSVATVSRIFSWFRQIPYTLLLVIVGLGLAFVDIRLVNLSPELILEIFLPPLLFEAAWNIRWRSLKDSLVPVTLFAVVGVIISVLGMAWALSTFTSLSLATALLVGASLSATDPVSVVALFRELGASKRLTILMEGESLFNDGVAVVAFVLLVGIPLGIEAFSLPTTIVKFVTFVGIGLGIGSVIGFGISYLTQRFDLPLVEQSLTLVSAYGTYLATEELGGSGVIGVVTVGVILGNFGSRIGMNPRTRLLVSEFWEFLAFFVNSIVFLLIGDQINFASLNNNLDLILVAIAAVLITRAIVIFGLGNISNLISGVKTNWREQTVLWWGGLRGSVSIALALSVPAFLTGRQEIIDTVFGVVLFTLLVQGLSTKWLLESLNLIGDQALKQEYSELLARRTALKRVLEYLDITDNVYDIDPEFLRYQKGLVKGELQSIEDRISKMKREHDNLRSLSREQLKEQLLDIEADTYAELIRAGQLNENLSPVLQEIMVEADLT
ncbi:Na(+)/H(+) antiporter ApNhaP [Hyella patelloides LEGE 07179]|uniref:Na(+)/H(+) antiporter ApNhaP n=1 Tax=Hyella patelloides LEGE 07179 TaxID=945734 RepID=A0A563VIM4_9CYAN|nr:sodium:proton antiporter [Hyella patelloides]VEP11243.1 Na(+)/H(+) antiporter ApNhaP [Hyella patelloides LEGE 07179]